jgi:hypothetical protein
MEFSLVYYVFIGFYECGLKKVKKAIPVTGLGGL